MMSLADTMAVNPRAILVLPPSNPRTSAPIVRGWIEARLSRICCQCCGEVALITIIRHQFALRSSVHAVMSCRLRLFDRQRRLQRNLDDRTASTGQRFYRKTAKEFRSVINPLADPFHNRSRNMYK